MIKDIEVKTSGGLNILGVALNLVAFSYSFILL